MVSAFLLLNAWVVAQTSELRPRGAKARWASRWLTRPLKGRASTVVPALVLGLCIFETENAGLGLCIRIRKRGARPLHFRIRELDTQ